MLDRFLREQLHGEHSCLVDLSLRGRVRSWRGERLEGPRLEKQEQGGCAQALLGAGLLPAGRGELKQSEA